MSVHSRSAAAVERVAVSAYAIPTDAPEGDGTLQWDKTVLVVAEVEAGAMRGLGYTYADAATAHFINEHLAPVIVGRDAYDVPAAWMAMRHMVRNLGQPGVSAMAISAVDSALWDVKSRLLDLPLAKLLGACRDEVPLYGSGGFTTYSIERLQEQLGQWAEAGFRFVKMKIGARPEDDIERIRAGAAAIAGFGAELFVDANGAYDRKQALWLAEEFADIGVSWFEEPVSSDDLEGLRLLRDRAPAGIDITAGEYGYDLPYFRRMLEAGAVDVLQADATRCGGITGFLTVAALCESFGLPLSTHCAPALHLPIGCAVTAKLAHLEYFHDHARIESMLFEGVMTPADGLLRPDFTRPGLGLNLKRQDADQFRVFAAEHPA